MTKKRKRKTTSVDRLAKHLKPGSKKGFSIGGTGASMTKKTKIDIEMGYDYRKRLKVPPVRGIKQLDKKDFKNLLKDGKTKRPRYARIDEIPMTKEEFKKKLEDGDFLTRRGHRTVTERRIAAMEFMVGVEERWWVQQQLSLLYIFDLKAEKEQEKLYKQWTKEMVPKVVRAILFLRKNNRTEDADALQEYFEGLVEANKPKKPVLSGLRYKVRSLTLAGDTMKLRQLFEELTPLWKALEESS